MKSATKPKPKAREASLQTICVEWFDAQYVFLATLLHHSPNGDRRADTWYNRKKLGEQKEMGVRNGWPDLYLAVPRLVVTPAGQLKTVWCPGLFIEMKFGDNGLSPEQRYVHARLRHAGYQVEVCRTLDKFMLIIKEYLLGVDLLPYIAVHRAVPPPPPTAKNVRAKSKIPLLRRPPEPIVKR